jgi:DNA polymerase-3 subunit beta
MIVHCQRDGLLTACQLVSVAVAARTTKPILMNIKAIAADDGLTLMATDLEIGIRYDLRGVRVEESGEAILPAARLVSILRESPDEELTVDGDERRCRVTTSVSEYEMPSEDPADFPDIPTFEESKYHELTAGTLREMIRQTVFAAGKDNSKYAITGILWEVEEKKARLVATDTKRLAVCTGLATVTAPVETKGQSHLVPTKAMNLLERNLNDENEAIQVSLRPNEVLFRTEKAVIYSRLVEGRYPPYRDIIPKKATARVPLPVEAFLTAVRQAAIMIDEESKKVAFRFAPGKLTLEAQGAATGRSKVEMKLDYDGPAVNINFDPHYLIEMLRVLEPGETLQLDLVDGQKPALFRHGEDYLYLVMPLT